MRPQDLRVRLFLRKIIRRNTSRNQSLTKLAKIRNFFMLILTTWRQTTRLIRYSIIKRQSAQSNNQARFWMINKALISILGLIFWMKKYQKSRAREMICLLQRLKTNPRSETQLLCVSFSVVIVTDLVQAPWGKKVAKHRNQCCINVSRATIRRCQGQENRFWAHRIIARRKGWCPWISTIRTSYWATKNKTVVALSRKRITATRESVHSRTQESEIEASMVASCKIKRSYRLQICSCLRQC